MPTLANADESQIIQAHSLSRTIGRAMALSSAAFGLLYLQGIVVNLATSGSFYPSGDDVKAVSAVIALLWNLALVILFVAVRREAEPSRSFFAESALESQAASSLLPLAALSLTIGFFEAVSWRGWVLLRLEEAFGIVPAILLGSLLYAAYHVGYAMPTSEIAFLFLVGVMYAVAFRLTRSVFILWPLFQPMG